MKRHILICLAVVAQFLTGLCFTAETHRTHQDASQAAVTNTSQSPSEPQLEAAAHQVMRNLVVFGVFALIGAVVVAGFAMYGAHRKFGVRGLIFVGVIIAFELVVMVRMLLLF